MRLRTWGSAVAALCCAFAVVSTPYVQSTKPSTTLPAISHIPPNFGLTSVVNSVLASRNHKQLSVLRVMVVGGSTARGFDDPKLIGYLRRALDQVSNALLIPLVFANKAKSGEIPGKLAPQYESLLQEIHPNVVIISWGLLNDIAKKTPQTVFQNEVQDEVAKAVKIGAEVWIVTPPATPATYVGHDVKPEPEYANEEVLGALRVHSPNVHVFDLLNMMKQYFAEHHESYKPFEANNWHMNHRGHVLAGKILGNSILARAKSLGLTS